MLDRADHPSLDAQVPLSSTLTSCRLPAYR